MILDQHENSAEERNEDFLSTNIGPIEWLGLYCQLIDDDKKNNELGVLFDICLH
jgi:hypothetical protein